MRHLLSLSYLIVASQAAYTATSTGTSDCVVATECNDLLFEGENIASRSVNTFLTEWREKVEVCENSGKQADRCTYTLEVLGSITWNGATWCQEGTRIGFAFEFENFDEIDTTWETGFSQCLSPEGVKYSTTTDVIDLENLCVEGTETIEKRDTEIVVAEGVIGLSTLQVEGQSCSGLSTIKASARAISTIRTSSETKYEVTASATNCIVGRCPEVVLGTQTVTDLQGYVETWKRAMDTCAPQQYEGCTYRLRAEVSTSIGGDLWCDDEAAGQVSIQMPVKGMGLNGMWDLTDSVDLKDCVDNTQVKKIDNMADLDVDACKTALTDGAEFNGFNPGSVQLGDNDVGFIGKKKASTTCPRGTVITASYLAAVEGTVERDASTTYTVKTVNTTCDLTKCDLGTDEVAVDDVMTYLETWTPLADACYKVEGQTEGCSLGLQLMIKSTPDADEWCHGSGNLGVLFPLTSGTKKFTTEAEWAITGRDLTACLNVQEGFVALTRPEEGNVCTQDKGVVEGVTLEAAKLTLPEGALGFAFSTMTSSGGLCYDGAEFTVNALYTHTVDPIPDPDEDTTSTEESTETTETTETESTTTRAAGAGSSLMAASLVLVFVASVTH